MTNRDARSVDSSGRLPRLSGPLFMGLFVGFFCPPCTSASAKGRCSPELHDQAVSILREAGGNWRSLLDHQKKFGVCDDGDLGEDYSDAVAQLFARKWVQFGAFVAISRHDQAFEHWAIKHIDATASYSDLSAIVHNASNCQSSREAGRLCKVIQHAAEGALADSKGAP